MAGDEGFEPPITGPEPVALPLGQSPSSELAAMSRFDVRQKLRLQPWFLLSIQHSVAVLLGLLNWKGFILVTVHDYTVWWAHFPDILPANYHEQFSLALDSGTIGSFMKLFLFTLFIVAMYGLPVYLYDNLLLPQVNQLFHLS